MYILKKYSNLSIAGHEPQVSLFEEHYLSESLYLNASTINSSTFPNSPTLIFKLHKKAKITDILSVDAMISSAILFNEKVKNIIDTCHLPKHCYYTAEVYDHNMKLHNYYWLHIPQSMENANENIDFQNSIFCVENIKEQKIDRFFQVSSIEELYSYEDDITDDELVITHKVKFNTVFDLFYEQLFFSVLFISENLVSLFKKQEITGYSLSEIPFHILNEGHNNKKILIEEEKLNIIKLTYNFLIKKSSFIDDINLEIKNNKKYFAFLRLNLYEKYKYDVFFLDENEPSNVDVLFPLDKIREHEVAFLTLWEKEKENIFTKISIAATKSVTFFYQDNKNTDYKFVIRNFIFPNFKTVHFYFLSVFGFSKII